MIARSLSCAALAATAIAGAAGCSTPPSERSEARRATTAQPTRGVFVHHRAGTGRAAEIRSAPPGAHLQYFGGRVLSNIDVVQVLYGAGSYPPEVSTTAPPSMASFYQGVLHSTYVDWLTEYDTTRQPPPTSNQTIGRGAFRTQVMITPSQANDGAVIDDLQIQGELIAQLAAGHLPPPTQDAAGNNNTYYAIFFPHGKTITLGGAPSCQFFCAYHGTIADAAGLGEITYGVHPDLQPGSDCASGCGAAPTLFGNYTQVASRMLVATMTDPEIGLSAGFASPRGWADLIFNEIGDICNQQYGQVVGGDGVTYDVQTQFSNSLGDCIVTNPATSPLIVRAPREACRGTVSLATVTVVGGAGRFTGDVALDLSGASPAQPPGGEITAAFDPDPVPVRSEAGATSTMRIATTAATPPGDYTLTVRANSTGLTTAATAPFTVRAQAPGAPHPIAPQGGADGVPAIATFAWSPVDDTIAYTLDIFDGSDCSGSPLASFTTAESSFTLPSSAALPIFALLSWRVSASNACGSSASSACLGFRTAACSDPRDVVRNGGFEDDLAGWTVDLDLPPPVVSGERPHTGAGAVLLGSTKLTDQPTGDVQISQILTLPAGGTSTLTFWEWPLSRASTGFDQQYVHVTPVDPPGELVVMMSEARDDEAYVQRELDLSQFAGMTIQLALGVHQDGAGETTAMFVDDIRVVAQRCGPPDFAVRVTPPEPSEVCAGDRLTFSVAVDSINGPNFVSPVTLDAGHLPPGATASFAQNPIRPGESTTLTVITAPSTPSHAFPIDVTGTADQPPPSGPRSVTAPIQVDASAPGAPELIAPRTGALAVPRRPTLSWTSPLVPDARVATLGFGAPRYQLQIARDAAFSRVEAEATVPTTSFTVPADLDLATQYFWRVRATNPCGTSPFSTTGAFIVGACAETWSQAAAVPLGSGPSQSSVIASPFDNKLYVIGGGIGIGPVSRIDQVWALDPASQTWTRKADVPPPGVGSSFGSAALIDRTIYVFGGALGPPGPSVPHRALWRYDIENDRWSRGADLPTDSFGTAVAAIDGKIYLAYGSGFVTQTWQYDPASDRYTRRADAPAVVSPERMHAVAIGGELHAFAGGFEGNAHMIYAPASDTWRAGPAMPFPATDPAVGVLGSKIFVVGGRPVAHTQVLDPATDTWSQAPPILGAPAGVDNTAGAVLGAAFHLIGGFDGRDGVNSHWQFHACDLGALSSAAIVPLVVDGDGTRSGIGNERTALVIDNAISGTAMSVTAFLFDPAGTLLGNRTFQLAPGELATIPDIMRALTATQTVQNAIGSVAVFGTEVFHAMASIVNGASGDPLYLEAQPIADQRSGLIPTVGWPGYTTQAVFSNASPATSVLQVLAYPPGGGDTPAAGTVVFVPPHGTTSFLDVVGQLGLPSGFSGQLTWSASEPIAAAVRDATGDRAFSGGATARGAASSTVFIPYVEDSDAYATALEVANPGTSPANVTVRFVAVNDPRGASSGAEHARDLAVASHGSAPIADVVRWAQRDGSTAPSQQRGFLVITAPQAIVVRARQVDRASGDPTVTDGAPALLGGFSPLVVRSDAPSPAAAGRRLAGAIEQSRFAVGNPGTAPATVRITATDATGETAGPALTLALAPDGQFFTDDLGAAMQLPPRFAGWVTVQSTAPILISHHHRTGTGGGALPIVAR